MPSRVQLHIYDLSSGMAASLSQSILGKKFDAVYHSGVVVYNTEYFFGDGIATGYPGATPYGKPLRVEEKGETIRNLDEIQAWIAEQNSSTFSGSTYNPLSHNCNHFSNAFLQFLNNSSVPDDVLKQPEELLSTDLGKLVGGLFGLQPQSEQSGSKTSENAFNPMQSLQRVMPGSFAPEVVDEQYKQLYIVTPRVYVDDNEKILEAIEKLADKGAKDELNKVYAAYQDSKDFQMSVQAVRAFGQLRGIDIVDYIDLLALIACTSSVDVIPNDSEPLALWGSQDVGAQAEVAFFRYLNNWLAEDRGMRDARKSPENYLQLIRQKIFVDNAQVRIGACRAHYTISRCLTSKNIKDTSAISFLLGALSEMLKSAKSGDKQFMACANLLSGALGRCLLTLKSRDAALFEVGRSQAQQQLDFGGLDAAKAPCITQLDDFLNAEAAAKKAQEEAAMF